MDKIINKKNINYFSSFSLFKSFWAEITNKRKSQLKLLIFLMLVNGAAEIISIGSLFPFLSVLTNNNYLWNKIFIRKIFFFFGITQQEQFFLVVTLLFASAVCISALIRVLNIWFTGRITAAIGNDLASKAFGRSLYQPYRVHISRNSSDLIAALSIQIDTTVAVIQSALFMFSSSVIMICILFSLIILNWKIALTILILLCTTYGIIKNFANLKLDSNSRKIDIITKQKIKSITEGFGAIREILLHGSQKTYIDIFKKRDLPLRILNVQNNLLSNSPRFIIEAFGILIIAGIAYFVVQSSANPNEVIPILGAIALGTQKLLPTSQIIYSSWAVLRGNTGALISVLKLLQQKIYSYENIKPNPVELKEEIVFKNVSFKYDKENDFSVTYLNFSIRKGEKIGFIGTTGSGKSTTIDLLMTLLKPTEGQIFLDGKELNENNINRIINWRASIAHVPQNIYLLDSSIKENIAFGISKDKIDFSQVRNAAKKSKIDKFIDSLPQGYETNVGERGVRLSGGQKQRIAIARALYKKSTILVFDEATSALDNATERDIMKSVDNLDNNLTLIIIAHRLSTLVNCDRIFEFKDGSIISVFKGNEIAERI